MVSLSAKIREQLISSFRADLSEQVQLMTDGLLALEQHQVSGEERQSTVENVFRAAHSLKGAARAVGVTAVEQLSHGLETVFTGLRNQQVEPTPALFTACFQALDAIQTVQTAYEAGETTPPVESLQALVALKSIGTGENENGAKNETTLAAPQKSEEQHEPAAVQHEPATVQHEPATVQHEPATVEHEPATAQDQPAPESASRGEDVRVARKTAGETIRVSVSKLDSLMAQLDELLLSKMRSQQRLAEMEQAQQHMERWQKEWHVARAAYQRLNNRDAEVRSALGLPQPSRWPYLPTRPVPSQGDNAPLASSATYAEFGKDIARLLDYVGESQQRMHNMAATINELTRQLANDSVHTALVIDGLVQEIKRVRMLPLSTITGPFGRMVRDLAQQSNKEARLEIVGGETELDKQVLEQIKDPLIHLLRNAVDHGIESPAERTRLEKERCGTVTLQAEQMGQEVVIRVADDGAGLDADAIRQAAGKQSRLDPNSIDDSDVAEAVFDFGLTTSPIITDISGRGIGLGIVRRNLEALHGRIELDWEANAGTRFTMTLPLTLSGTHALLVRVAEQQFGIPFTAIDHILTIRTQEIFSLEGSDAIRHNGRPISLTRLSDVLELPPANNTHSQEFIPAVVLAAADRQVAFVVDELVGEQEAVVKGLGKQLVRVAGVAGAMMTGDGQVILILNANDLIKLALGKKHRQIRAEREQVAGPGYQARILVVDDSITTRTLEKNILEAAGYQVELATDGREALEAIAAGGAPDLVVSDVLMPRMDGFELTRRIKEQPHTAHLPVILVTSLESPQDRARGIEVGADAYIVKSGFDQTNLLETVEQLI